MIFLGSFIQVEPGKYLPGEQYNDVLNPVYGKKHLDGKLYTADELRASGMLLEALPQPEDNGKAYTLYCNPETQAVWYEYYDIPAPQPTPEERIKALEEENRTLKQQQAAISADLQAFMDYVTTA